MFTPDMSWQRQGFQRCTSAAAGSFPGPFWEATAPSFPLWVVSGIGSGDRKKGMLLVRIQSAHMLALFTP